MISLIRLRVSSRTNGDSLITRETVFLETFARRAISLIVCFFSNVRRNAGRDSTLATGRVSETARVLAGGACRVAFLAGFRTIGRRYLTMSAQRTSTLSEYLAGSDRGSEPY